MPSTRTSLSYGVVRSPAFAATARRCQAPHGQASRPPIGLGLSLAALVSVALWIAAGVGVHTVVVACARFAGA